MVFTTLEKAIHAKFTDFNTEVEHYRITYTMKNNNADRVNRCDFDYILVDSAGHQLNETFIVPDDGYHGDEIFSGVEITSREWFETQNNITGASDLFQPSSNILGNNNETCPGFEIKFNVPENQILTPQQLVLLDDETVIPTTNDKNTNSNNDATVFDVNIGQEVQLQQYKYTINNFEEVNQISNIFFQKEATQEPILFSCI